jgi:uncharacterized Zn finger protein
MTATAFILRQIDSKQLEKAVAALKQEAYTLRTTRIADRTVSPFVGNEKGQNKTVFLSPFSASCSCLDSIEKLGGFCKHAVAVAVQFQQDGVNNPQARCLTSP